MIGIWLELPGELQSGNGNIGSPENRNENQTGLKVPGAMDFRHTAMILQQKEPGL